MTDNINGNTVKRLIKDVKEILNYSSNDNNIYYKHHDSNILLGYALIIGNNNSSTFQLVAVQKWFKMVIKYFAAWF